MNNETASNFLQNAECLFSQSEIDQALDKMAADISSKLSDKNPLCLNVLIGGSIFTGQLLPKLLFPLELDYLHATRYRGDIVGQDALHWLAKPNMPLKDRTILILDDILDEGITLAEIIKFCKAHGAKEVYTAVLVEKDLPGPRPTNGVKEASFVALKAPNRFLFGYGMDYKENWRNAPGIYALKE